VLYRARIAFYLLVTVEWTPKCPTCKRPLSGEPGGAAEWPYRPFCSERCRSIDLGSWLDGAYRIGSPASEEDLDGASAEQDRSSTDDDDKD
jgi:endogenous inhibitor of DNA gyrase (YacG/DUF329 family)